MIDIILWLFFAGCCALLLQLVWMPVFWRMSLFVVTVNLVLLWIIYRLRCPARYVSIDELGAFCRRGDDYFRLDFVRVNSIQLIAKYKRKQGFLDYVWPAFMVIYRDSVSYENYRILRSFAAQQILLRRSEEAKKVLNR